MGASKKVARLERWVGRTEESDVGNKGRKKRRKRGRKEWVEEK